MKDLNQLLELGKQWFGDNYDKLLPKIKTYTKQVGRKAAKPLLEIYFVLKVDSTPRSEKGWIIAALAYIFVPLDLIPFRKFGLLGWLDDGAAIAFAYNKVKKHITPQISFEVDRMLDLWFSETLVEIVN